MHKPIKFIYALLIITIVASSVTWYILCEVKKNEIAMDAPVIPEPQKQEKELLVVESIEGTYVSSDDSQCKMQLRIYKENDGYLYVLKTPEREIKDILSFAINPDNEIYIILEGIEWAEDFFDVALPDISSEQQAEYDNLIKEGNRNIGIDGFVSENEINIQNYGNAMNYYTKLGECGDKYIRLIK